MIRLPFSLQSCSLFGLVVIFLFSGCRSYGGHGSEEALYNQIGEANRVFADELRRAQADATLLTSAAQSDARLTPFQARYEGMLAAHEALLVEHQQKEEELSEGSSHRQLGRTFGAIVADHRLMKYQYFGTLQAISRLNTERPLYSPRLFNQGLSSVTPAFYERVQSEMNQQLNMRRALAAAAEEGDIEQGEEFDDEEGDTVEEEQPDEETAVDV